MENNRKHFWCAGCFEKVEISEKQEQLESKTLCKTCYNKGFRLKKVVRAVRHGK